MSFDCPDPFHEGESEGEAYTIPALPGDTWVASGWRCPTCGFQTVTRTWFTPVPKTCGQCGQDFPGDPEEDGEVCLSCFKANLAKLDLRQLAKDHNDE